MRATAALSLRENRSSESVLRRQSIKACIQLASTTTQQGVLKKILSTCHQSCVASRAEQVMEASARKTLRLPASRLEPHAASKSDFKGPGRSWGHFFLPTRVQPILSYLYLSMCVRFTAAVTTKKRDRGCVEPVGHNATLAFPQTVPTQRDASLGTERAPLAHNVYPHLRRTPRSSAVQQARRELLRHDLLRAAGGRQRTLRLLPAGGAQLRSVPPGLWLGQPYGGARWGVHGR